MIWAAFYALIWVVILVILFFLIDDQLRHPNLYDWRLGILVRLRGQIVDVLRVGHDTRVVSNLIGVHFSFRHQHEFSLPAEGSDGGGARDGLPEVRVDRRPGDRLQPLQLAGCVDVECLDEEEEDRDGNNDGDKDRDDGHDGDDGRHKVGQLAE